MKEKSLYWIIGLLVSLSGVVLSGNATVGTSQTLSAYIIGIKITNRIYNDSLTDQQSMPYKILREEVENVFLNTYSNTPSIEYEGISEMTFSNGSVIATSTALFGSTQINQYLVKNIFVTNYLTNPSLVLDLNISYTSDQEPTPATLPLEQESKSTPSSVSISTTTRTSMASGSASTLSSTYSSTHSSTNSSTLSSTHASALSTTYTSTQAFTNSSTLSSTHSSTNSSTLSFTHSSTNFSTDPSTNSSTLSSTQASTISSTQSSTNSSTHPFTHSSTNSSTHPSTNSSTLSSAHAPTISSAHSSTNSSTNSSTHFSTHTSTYASAITTSHSSKDPTSHSTRPPQSHTDTGHVVSTTSQRPDSLNNETHVTVLQVNSSTHYRNETVNATINTNITVDPNHLTTPSSNHSASNHSAIPGGNVTEKPSGPELSGTARPGQSTPSSTSTGSEAEQGVPGWGIALLVLAAIILFLLLLLFILLLLCWCCWWRRRGFMNVSDPDPPGYYNPDIPLYSTHSTFESYNGKSPVHP